MMPSTIHYSQGREEPLMTLRDVSKTYSNSNDTTQVLKNLDLELYRGEIVSLIGPSGSGKSTIIALIAGLLVPDSGRVSFGGITLSDMVDSQRAELRASRIGIVLQSGNLVPFLTAGENVALAFRLAGRPASATTVASLLEEVGLADRGGHLPRRLSGGEAQRVALAVALANTPDLLLADEAVGQLDSATARSVMRTLEDASRNRGLAVLLVTHSDEIAARASRVVSLVDGRLEVAA